MSIAISSALSRIRTNLILMNASASRLAGQPADSVPELVEQLDIKGSFQANVTTLETAHEMDRAVIRLWA